MSPIRRASEPARLGSNIMSTYSSDDSHVTDESSLPSIYVTPDTPTGTTFPEIHGEGCNPGAGPTTVGVTSKSRSSLKSRPYVTPTIEEEP